MTDRITLEKQDKNLKGTVALPASKSESNRMLIIAAAASESIEIRNLSSARDTQTMQRLLRSNDEVLDVIDAGTTMRFLTALMAVKGRPCILTGTDRMKQRPIGLLVDALRTLGCKITYLEKEGFPPLKIEAPTHTLNSNKINIKGDVSSQYISALLMIAPLLPQGLELELIGSIGSKPYIEMTLGLMKKFGASAEWKDQNIRVAPGKYHGGMISIESDWSAASYWYSMAALATDASILLKGLRPNSLQADLRTAVIYDKLGVKSTFTAEGVQLTKKAQSAFNHIDFKDCPDIAQTIAVTCAVLGKPCTFSGLESLRIKETDRIAALQNELAKIGAQLIEKEAEWNLIPSDKLPEKVEIDTYEDHRMAMAFAPLMLRMKVNIHEPKVVAKSYPEFWDHISEVL